MRDKIKSVAENHYFLPTDLFFFLFICYLLSFPFIFIFIVVATKYSLSVFILFPEVETLNWITLELINFILHCNKLQIYCINYIFQAFVCIFILCLMVFLIFFFVLIFFLMKFFWKAIHKIYRKLDFVLELAILIIYFL